MVLRLGRPTASPFPEVRLEGRRVMLRPPQAEDWREWAELREASRSFLTPWEPSWPPDSLTRTAYLQRLRRQIQDWRNGVGFAFFTFERSQGQLIGGIGLTQVRRGVAQTGTLGYWCGAAFANQGYTSEALRQVVAFAFTELDLHRVEAACLPENAASRALLARLGFQEEGMARGYLKINGRWRDHLLFARLCDDAADSAG